MFVIRYRPDTDLGRRFGGTSAGYDTREQAERLRAACANAAEMEVIEIEGEDA